MKKVTACFLAVVLLAASAFASRDEREQERVKEAGEVLKEILNIPDDIPQDLLDKAECLIILPSVKKGAFGIGGSYGRGAMICRGVYHHKGKWGAPAPSPREGQGIGVPLAGHAQHSLLRLHNPH